MNCFVVFLDQSIMHMFVLIFKFFMFFIRL